MASGGAALWHPLAPESIRMIPLGETDTLFTGAPHDGMRPLSELVSWSVS